MNLPRLFIRPQLSKILKREVLTGMLAVSVCLLFLFSRASSHDPITTSVTFNKEVIRILQRSCLGCHSNHSLINIPLTSFEQARPWAKAIKEEVLEKRMPPFQAVRGYGDFHNGYLLPHRDVELIVSWVEGGAPKGEDKDFPRELINSDWAFGQPDLNLQPEQVINLPAGEGDEVRCLKLPTNLAADRWINALDFHPTNSRIVDAAEFAVARQGVDACGNHSSLEKIGAWVPGQEAIRLPADAGFLLPANSSIVMKIRYRKAAEAATDHSTLGVYFAKGEKIRTVKSVPVASLPMLIPAGAARQRVKAAWTMRETSTLFAVRPLLFPLGKSVEVTACKPDGSTEVMILVRDYRYDWQPIYQFREPVTLPAGTRLEVTSWLDNSDNNPNLRDQKPRPKRTKLTLCELLLAAG